MHYALHRKGIDAAALSLDSNCAVDLAAPIAASLAMGDICQKWNLGIPENEWPSAISSIFLKCRIVSYSALLAGICQQDWLSVSASLSAMHTEVISGVLRHATMIDQLNGISPGFLRPLDGRLSESDFRKLATAENVFDLRDIATNAAPLAAMWQKGVRINWDTPLSDEEWDCLQHSLAYTSKLDLKHQ